MSESVILIGGGGHAKVIIDCIRTAGDKVIGILDDNLPVGRIISGTSVLGPVSQWADYSENKFFLAIGNNAVRKKLDSVMHANWYTAIHPSAVVSPQAKIGSGTVIMPGAIVNSDAVIGKHCIINSGAIIEHDNILGDYVHISPRAALGGTVRIGEKTHVGIGAIIKNNITVCEDCTLGAGSVTVKNVEVPGTYVGVPIRRIR